MKKTISLILAAILLLSAAACGASKPATPEEAVDTFFAGNYAYRTTVEQLGESGEIEKTVIEGKRTNGEKATEYYKYLESPYTLSWDECYAVETSNGTSSVKLHMSTDEWVLTTGYLGTPSYHENLKFVCEETVNDKVCEKYTTSYLWTVPKEYNLTEEENAALSNTTITLSYWMDKETGLPVKIVTDNGDALRWANIAYTYANRYASMQFNMTLEDAIALYPEETTYHNVQIFEVLDFGDHITIEDPHPSSK